MNEIEKGYKPFTENGLPKFTIVDGFKLKAYVPSPELVQAVEIARLLKRPLLLRGEPGCGKTRLAEAIAYELHPKALKHNLFHWPIKSTTTAKEGLYSFNHLSRLRDVEAQKSGGTKEKDLMEYVDFGPLGRAFQQSSENSEANLPPPVLLIDEIDKADIDFPNDLLWELDKKEFFITEVGNRAIRTDTPPIVVITSNNEKELSNAFLRRCLFHFIEFPVGSRLVSIVSKMVEGELKAPFEKKDIENIVGKFIEKRKELANSATTQHNPSTSELLDWVRTIAYYLYSDTKKGEKWGYDPGEGYLFRGRGKNKVIIRMEQVILKSDEDYRRQVNNK